MKIETLVTTFDSNVHDSLEAAQKHLDNLLSNLVIRDLARQLNDCKDIALHILSENEGAVMQYFKIMNDLQEVNEAIEAEFSQAITSR